MKFADLVPEFITHERRNVGVKFACPCCGTHYISVLFLNPPDGGKSVPHDQEIEGQNYGNRWARSGLTFDDMSLSPEIDASSSGHAQVEILHGEVVVYVNIDTEVG